MDGLYGLGYSFRTRMGILLVQLPARGVVGVRGAYRLSRSASVFRYKASFTEKFDFLLFRIKSR